MSAWTVVADLDLCQGHQVCRLDAPEVFGFDRATDKVVVLTERPPDDLRGQVKLAVANCPAMALDLIEED